MELLEKFNLTVIEKLVKANLNENDDLFELTKATISKEKRAQRFNLLRALTREGVEFDGYYYLIQEADGGDAHYDIEWFELVVEKLTRANQEDDIEIFPLDKEIFNKIFSVAKDIERYLCNIEAREWENRYQPNIETILRDVYKLNEWQVRRLLKAFE